MSHESDNIFAGTQVVSLVEVRGTNNSLVHPRSAVGEVTRTPAVDGEKFYLRFPDGFEASFDHKQLEVLKHFKDRLGEVRNARKQSGENTTLEDADVAFHQREYEGLCVELQAAHDTSQLPELPSDETRKVLDLPVRLRLGRQPRPGIGS